MGKDAHAYAKACAYVYAYAYACAYMDWGGAIGTDRACLPCMSAFSKTKVAAASEVVFSCFVYVQTETQ